MGFFSFSFGQNQEKHIYLAGWEAVFNGDEQCQKFLETQVIDKQTANAVWSSIDLVFIDGNLVKAYDNDEGNITERKLDATELGMPFQELSPNQLYSIRKSSKSKSYLGGEVPDELNIPRFDFNAPLQFLGKLSKFDEAFSWLPNDLYLIAPLYSDFHEIFIDYSDPLNPKILNIDDLKDAGSSYDNVTSDSEIVFEKMFITTQKSSDYGYGQGHTGVPNWIQYPDIPSCPKSNRTMKFLCQLTDAVDVKTKRTNVKYKDDWDKQYFERMNFWGDGDLYIFYDPESKIACLFIQNT